MSNPTPDPVTAPEVELPAEEDKASLRRTFVILTFVGACILLPPRQWVSAGILFVVSGALLFRHRRIQKREEALRPKPPKPIAAQAAPRS